MWNQGIFQWRKNEKSCREMLGKTTREQQWPPQTTRRDKLLSRIVAGSRPPTVIPCICFSSCPSLKLYGHSCWFLLQSDNHSSHCFDVPSSLLCFSSFSQRIPVPQDESGLLLKTTVLAGPRQKGCGLRYSSCQRSRKQLITTGVSKSLEELRVTSLFMHFISPYSL